MYCQKCGKEIEDGSTFCPYCGAKVASAENAQIADAPNTGYAVLGFFIPLAGLILWLYLKDSAPLRAKSAGKGALIGAIVSAVFYVLAIVVQVMLVTGAAFY